VSVAGVVLFPGAGSDRDHSSLLRIEEAFGSTPVARVDFPYRRAGKKMPDRAPVLMQCVRDEVKRYAKEWGTEPSRLVIGGRSMGGRMCSMVVSDEQDSLRVAGLVLLSYPLHPPRKPEKLRTEHLNRITVPSLWISGTRDTFGTPEELQSAMDLVVAPKSAHFIERKGHDLKDCDDDIARLVVEWTTTLTV
jgi:uncharacterized protein